MHSNIFRTKTVPDRRLTSAWSGQGLCLDLVGYHSGFDEARHWSRTFKNIASGEIREQY